MPTKARQLLTQRIGTDKETRALAPVSRHQSSQRLQKDFFLPPELLFKQSKHDDDHAASPAREPPAHRHGVDRGGRPRRGVDGRAALLGDRAAVLTQCRDPDGLPAGERPRHRLLGVRVGFLGRSDYAAYCTAKASEIHLARCLALEGAPMGVRVNVVNPDAVLKGSKIWQGEWLDQRADTYGTDKDGLEAMYRDRSMLKRSVLPEDIAEAAYFLASDLWSKSTGNIINGRNSRAPPLHNHHHHNHHHPDRHPDRTRQGLCVRARASRGEPTAGAELHCKRPTC